MQNRGGILGYCSCLVHGWIPFWFGAQGEQRAGQPSISGAEFTAFRSPPQRHNRPEQQIEQYWQRIRHSWELAVGSAGSNARTLLRSCARRPINFAASAQRGCGYASTI